MDVTIFGKALTPISHECLLHLPQSVRENDYRNKKVPYYKCYTDLKSMQIYHGEDKHEQHWNPKFEKTRMNLSPIFRNMTLSETYNFAREQLKRYPSQTSTRITEQPCNFQFRKVHDCNINQETTTEKQSQKFKPDVVIASSGGAASEKTTETSLLDAEIYSRKVQHRAKSVVGHLKKSARRKKKSPNLKKELKNEEITLSKFMRGEKISPIRTSASMPSRLNTVTSCKNSTVQPFTNLATHRVKPLTTHGVRRTTALPQQTRQSLDKSIGCKVDDLLLSSLGMKIHHYCRERNSRVKIFVTDASPNKRKV